MIYEDTSPTQPGFQCGKLLQKHAVQGCGSIHMATIKQLSTA